MRASPAPAFGSASGGQTAGGRATLLRRGYAMTRGGVDALHPEKQKGAPLPERP